MTFAALDAGQGKGRLFKKKKKTKVLSAQHLMRGRHINARSNR